MSVGVWSSQITQVLTFGLQVGTMRQTEKFIEIESERERGMGKEKWQGGKETDLDGWPTG